VNCEGSNLADHSHGNGATSMKELPQLLDGIHEFGWKNGKNATIEAMDMNEEKKSKKAEVNWKTNWVAGKQ
jgi:hypothetical protein